MLVNRYELRIALAWVGTSKEIFPATTQFSFGLVLVDSFSGEQFANLLNFLKGT